MIDDPLNDQKTVDLARHRQKPLVNRIASLKKRDQKRPAELTQGCLDAPENLVDEKQVHLFDVRLGRKALDADEPNHLLATARQALGSPVGDIAQLVDHPEHSLSCRGADPVVAVHDA